MKKKNLLIGIASIALLLAGCNQPSDGGGSVVPPGPVIVDDYKIMVTAPTSVHYSINKERAKEGEEVILVINSIDEGFNLKEVVLNTNRTLTPEADGKTYKFSMPNQSASIVIRVSVNGDVVIDGDFVAAFTKESSGIWAARNVSVPAGSGLFAKFNIKVGESKLQALDLDESVSFGDIHMITGNQNYNFEISRGATYDFFYDESKDEAPFSVQRKRIDNYPTTAPQLAAVLIDSYAVRSEPAMYIPDLATAEYEIMDKSTTDVFNHKFSWKKYNNNTTLATIEDKLDDHNMLVYRHYDETNKTYEVVDTYALKEGSKTINDDRFRESYNNYGAYSARYDVIDGDDYGFRYAKNKTSVMREINSTSHNPAYLLEKDIMWAYRVGVTGDDVSWSVSTIVSNPTTNGFTTAVDTTVEYDHSASTYLSERHEAYVYDVDLSFDERGAVTSLVYKETLFSKDQWDFQQHKPLTGQTGSVKIKINASYTYGVANEACTFDPSPYFITSIDSYRYVSKSITDKATVATDSYFALGEGVMISDGSGKIKDEITISYTPSTALDLWEYGPVASSNEDVIAKLPTDLYYQMAAHNEGDSVVTFSNHVNAATIKGASLDVNCHVIAGKDIRSFYIMDVISDPSYAPVESWYQANVHANGTYKFRIQPSPSGSPLVYTATSSNTSLLTIKSAPNSADLVIDTTGAKNITENVKVNITINSTRYEAGATPTVLEIYIIPAHANPVGTWDSTSYPDTHLVFTTEEYQNGYSKGYISDHYFTDEGEDLGTDVFYFAYKYDGSYVDAYIYAMDIQTMTSKPAVADMYLEFYYDAPTGYFCVFLAEREIDEEFNTYYTPILGDVDEAYQPHGFHPFARHNG